MRAILPSLLLSLSLFVNIGLGAVLFFTEADSFRVIVTAAQSIQDSRADIRSSVSSFNTAVMNIENLTEQVQAELGKVDTHVREVRGDLSRIESLLKY